MPKCIICGKKEFTYPSNPATGFHFCDNCLPKVARASRKYKGKILSNWLRAIANVIDEHSKE